MLGRDVLGGKGRCATIDEETVSVVVAAAAPAPAAAAAEEEDEEEEGAEDVGTDATSWTEDFWSCCSKGKGGRVRATSLLGLAKDRKTALLLGFLEEAAASLCFWSSISSLCTSSSWVCSSSSS